MVSLYIDLGGRHFKFLSAFIANSMAFSKMGYIKPSTSPNDNEEYTYDPRDEKTKSQSVVYF